MSGNNAEPFLLFIKAMTCISTIIKVINAKTM